MYAVVGIYDRDDSAARINIIYLIYIYTHDGYDVTGRVHIGIDICTRKEKKKSSAVARPTISICSERACYATAMGICTRENDRRTKWPFRSVRGLLCWYNSLCGRATTNKTRVGNTTAAAIEVGQTLVYLQLARI